MIISIARQSVILKCKQRKSAMLGNYEFYYAAGLMKKLYALQLEESMQPMAIYEELEKRFDSIKPSDENEEYLVKMLKSYEVLPEYDEQMVQLFRWGEQERDLWQVQTSYEG